MSGDANPMEKLLKRFQSFKPPILQGTENAVDCENWLEDIEQLFESLDYTDERRVRLVIHQLHGLAKNWWVEAKKAFENQGTVITWAIFKTAFYQRFFPVSYLKDKGAEFASFQQRQMNIEDYVAKFTSLLKFAPHIAANDEAQADQFINDLNPDVFTLVVALLVRVDPDSLEVDRNPVLLMSTVLNVEDITPMSSAEECLVVVTFANNRVILREYVHSEVLEV
ncbi:uncharacterized protein [Henckelia pumila]|uniref:uncharacterized protein n=1 Tax=Henckelia pumila TaxID=405737 RepID=UPI003C6E367E